MPRNAAVRFDSANTQAIVRSERPHRERSPKKIHHSAPSAIKSPCPRIPAPQIERIKQRHVMGQSQREIARADRRSRPTIARIVKGGSILLCSLNEIRAEECEYLRTEMPSVLHQLTEDLLAGTLPTESAWYGDLVLKLMQSVGRVGSDLLSATELPEALSTVAWNARNMAEMWIWTKYCGSSKENAWRFHSDALRDSKGIVLSLAQLNKFAGSRWEQEQHMDEILDHVAQTRLGLDSIDASYASVSSAAKEMGLSEWYLPTDRFLSKCAHPTAILVIGIMHQTESLRDMQSVCLLLGTRAARQCNLICNGSFTP